MKVGCLFVLMLLWPGGLSCQFPSKGDTRLENLKALKLIVGIFHREDAPFFNQYLTENDMVFVWGEKRHLLELIKGPQLVITAPSLSELEKRLQVFEGLELDYANYNPEQWRSSGTPPEEYNDLPAAVQKARDLVQARGLKLSFVTDHILLEKYGEQIAPLVDLFGIQIQRYQWKSLEEFRQEAAQKVALVRQGSPQVEIFLQISMVPPKWNGKKSYEAIGLDRVWKQMELIHDLADGIAILYSEETRSEVKELIRRLRG